MYFILIIITRISMPLYYIIVILAYHEISSGLALETSGVLCPSFTRDRIHFTGIVASVTTFVQHGIRVRLGHAAPIRINFAHHHGQRIRTYHAGTEM